MLIEMPTTRGLDRNFEARERQRINSRLDAELGAARPPQVTVNVAPPPRENPRPIPVQPSAPNPIPQFLAEENQMLNEAREERRASRGVMRSVARAAGSTVAAGASAGANFVKREVKFTRNYGVFFLIAYFVNILDGLTNYSRVAFRVTWYFLLGFFGWLLVYRESGDTFRGHMKTLFLSLLLATAALFWPIILLTLPTYIPIDITLCRVLANIFPFFLIYLFTFERDPAAKESRIIHWSKVIYFISLILVGLSFIPALIESQSWQNIPYLQPAKNAELYGTYSNYIALAENGWTWIKESTIKAGKDVNSFWELQKKQALGDLYVGEVDSRANQILGIEMTNVKAAQKMYVVSDEIEAQGTIKVQTIDKKIMVELSCILDKDGKKPIEATQYSPSKSFEIEGQNEFVSCVFPAGSGDAGSHSITVTSKFNFITSAYTPVYFTDKEQARGIKSGTSIYEYFQIREPGEEGLAAQGKISTGDVKTYYTSGPVNIGMNVPNLVTEIDQTLPEKKFNLHISFTNLWGTQYGGRLMNIHDWYIQIPKEMQLVPNEGGEIRCSGRKFVVSQCPSDDARCDRANFITYVMDPSQKIDEVDIADTISCPVTLTGNNYPALLGSYPLAARQFRTWMSYDYVYEKRVPIMVKKEV
jgi:hypothetical protein